MKKRSTFFYPGQRLTNSMLTIVDSVRPDSWDQIVCKCECGNTIVLPYMKVYSHKFSCGCKRRSPLENAPIPHGPMPRTARQRSRMFHPGQRLESTMLTIVDSAQPESWR